MPPDSNGDPLKIAVLSDVHGNLPAFRAVLEAVKAEDFDRIWFLGDLVGYGAFPDECVEMAAENCHICLAGNHDLGVLGRIDIADFSAHAAEAARWTRDHVGKGTLEFLGSLREQRDGEAIGLWHASPRDPVWEYVLSIPQAGECIDAMEARVGAVGHTHVACWFTQSDNGPKGDAAMEGLHQDLSDGRWLLNPGSVGQPRDGDPRAAWLALDLDQWTADWRRVEYPIQEAADAIDAAGLPSSLGQRLFIGQ